MTVRMLDQITATLLEGAGIDLGRVDGEAAMDESWAPYARAELTIALPDEVTLELLDARQHRRVKIEATSTYPDSFIPTKSRLFDLGLRRRQVDQEAGSVRLSLASDEALLMDDVLLDSTPLDLWAYRSSLRAIINVVLARHGAALEPGTVDADMTPHWDVTNLFPNPSAETNVASWSPGSGASALASTVLASPPVPLGTDAMRWTASAGASWVVAGHNGTAYKVVRVSPGRSYVGAVHTVTSGTQRPIGAVLQFYAEDGAALLGSVASPVVTPPGVVFVRHHAIGVAPAGAAFAALRINTESNTAGQFHYADAAMIYEGTRLIDPFDGDTTPTASYTCAWAATAHASESTRTALDPADPDALLWQPGVTAWDFLQPLFQRDGLRLFCDEQRRWFLVDGAAFVAPGVLQLTMPGNLHAADEVIDRDGDWFDAALARYRWTDRDGISQERIDFYGAPGYSKVRTFDIDAAYPGAGFAEYAVARSEGRGRTVDLEALINLDVTPSQILQVNLPDTPELIGVVRNAEFDFTAGTMRVASRGLTDVPDGAYILAAEGMTYSEAPVGVTYAEWINPNGA